MKIFKGVLIALYAFIVLGSVQNYSAQYNGQEVFSLIGIGDNFVLTAIIPLIIYGVGRKFFFKKPKPTSVYKPEISEQKKSIRVWQVLLPVILGLIVLQVILTVSAFLGD